MIDFEATKHGDWVSEFIKSIGRAERVIVIISDKYLRSIHCMRELYNVFQEAKHDKHIFLKRIHPRVLDDAKINDLQDRIYWVEFWQEQAQQMEKELAKIDSEDFELYQLMKSLVRHVNNMLAFIADKIRFPDGIDADF